MLDTLSLSLGFGVLIIKWNVCIWGIGDGKERFKFPLI